VQRKAEAKLRHVEAKVRDLHSPDRCGNWFGPAGPGNRPIVVRFYGVWSRKIARETRTTLQRRVDVFTAAWPLCEDTVRLVSSLALPQLRGASPCSPGRLCDEWMPWGDGPLRGHSCSARHGEWCLGGLLSASIDHCWSFDRCRDRLPV